MARPELPSGTVTFLFTDVEGSTRLLHALGADAYASALAEHRATLREAFARHGGVEVDTQGDAFFVAFPTAPGALAAATEATEALRGGPIHVRIGLHTGTPLLTAEGYVGPDVHKGARIAAAGHGGQILVSAATAALLDANLRDMGEHRLKDLTAPERIFQADDGDHPPLKTLHQTNLPIPATPFLGREREVRQITDLLRRGDVRLLTLTGPGGTGKTRLALQAAAEAADHFPDGVWWVPLAGLRDSALVLPTVASTLGTTTALADHIGDRAMAILLDNFEHLADGAPHLAPLLSACPNLQLVVTSRERLRLDGEWEYPVEPMRAADAGALFVARARAAGRDVSDAPELRGICERLDHLPLAIELAAARIKMLAPEAMLARLEQRLPLLAGGHRDAPERQRTLRATIEWSHELLTAREQQLFARLAVFREGWTLEAAEAVVAADLDTLESLVDRSLVRARSDGRFGMLETIREFAVERLEASGDALDVRRRHAEYFLDLAERAEPHLRTDDQAWLDRLAADEDNIRAALEHADATGDADTLMRIVAAVWRLWYQKTRYREGSTWLERAEACVERSDPRVAPTICVARAVMSTSLGRIDLALGQAQRALELYRSIGDRWGEAYAKLVLSAAFSDTRGPAPDRPMARELLETALHGFDEVGDEHYALLARYNLALLYADDGDRARAGELWERTLDTARRRGVTAIEGDSLLELARSARLEGRLTDAIVLAREAVRVHHRRGSLRVAAPVGEVAAVLAHDDDPETAAVLLGAKLAVRERLGIVAPPLAVRDDEAIERMVVDRLGRAAFDRALAAGRRMPVDEAVALALGTGDGAAA